jgi:uncharacterized protein (TIGR02466 family)|tara:strand:+ start:168 stop:812 length:645 start_codon:yes stop_codon:yes gene_type:complete
MTKENVNIKPTFLNLWPTVFMQLSLPGHESANPVLADLILSKNVEVQNMTENYNEDNIFNMDHPVIFWLQQCIDKAIDDYSKNSGINYTLNWKLQGWGNVNMKGDYHNLHNHPHSWLSGTYYVNVPDQTDAEIFRNDLNPASISFFDPRPQANMNSIKNDKQVDPEYRVLPQSGDLFIWPAFIHHLVHPNMSDAPRLSLSFNVIVEWSDELIPN